MEEIIIYTDGGCIGNPGTGAWAFAIYTSEGKLLHSDAAAEAQSTNNRMELTAVIRVLEWLLAQGAPAGIPLHTDSQYVQKGITQWIQSWIRNGWKTAAKAPVKNKDLWMRLKELDDRVKPSWTWVKGHAGTEGNEFCDQLVNEKMRSL